MSERIEKMVLIVSNAGQGIEEAVERSGFVSLGIVPHNEWNQHLQRMDSCHLVIIDEVGVERSTSGILNDIEDRMLTGNSGPLILLLVDDNDHGLDFHERLHPKCKVHPLSRSLDAILQELHAAAPNTRAHLLKQGFTIGQF